MSPFFRALLFRLDAERAHVLTLSLVRLAGRLPPLWALLHQAFAGPQKPVQVFGLQFSNPVGLAAGYDKDGLGWRGLACLGFGHIEVGTVTMRPQAGNPKPRLFRLAQDQALINRLGFPGKGAEFVARQLRGPRSAGLVIGVNLGMNRDTPLEQAARDYSALVRVFTPLADYLCINVSSPNTLGLRRLQARQALSVLLSALAGVRQVEGRQVSMLVKLAPDLADGELEDALQAIFDTGMDGVVATNTTLSREGVRSELRSESGGLSGAPLHQQSTQMIRKIVHYSNGKLPVVGVGGVMSAADAREKLEAGASLVQVYTGLVYAGPGLVRQILQGL